MDKKVILKSLYAKLSLIYKKNLSNFNLDLYLLVNKIKV